MPRMLTDIPQTNATETTAHLGAETHLAPVGTMVRAAVVNQKADRLSDLHSSYDFAAYLAGRSSLVLPPWTGGGTGKASKHFKRAVAREGQMTSQAYVGLAESLAAAGDTSGAVDAYEHALHNIDAADPRGIARKEKISGAVAQLTGAAYGRP